jgi:hypothetical protein
MAVDPSADRGLRDARPVPPAHQAAVARSSGDGEGTAAGRRAAGDDAPVCRCCGTRLVRRGDYYWHVTPQGRCPVTCWPAATIEGRIGTA